MKNLLIVTALFLSFSFCTNESKLADTWAGTASNQLVIGNAVRDGGNGGSCCFTITTTIPSSLNKKALTKAELATYTDIPTGNTPLGAMPSNQCPTKEQIEATF